MRKTPAWLLTAVLLLAVLCDAAGGAGLLSSAGFSDTAGHWGAEYIDEAASLGLFKGFEDGSFRPDEAITRAQFVTVVWRMAGSPAAADAAPFTDVGGQPEEFRAAISWAYSTGCINGTSADTFLPDGVLTREAAMQILFRYAGAISGQELLFTGIYDDAFADSGAISAWARAAMYWGVYNELISGTGNTMLSPQGAATRAQIAKILVNYYYATGGAA